MLAHIQTDGSETGLTSADKINLGFIKTDSNETRIITAETDIDDLEIDVENVIDQTTLNTIQIGLNTDDLVPLNEYNSKISYNTNKVTNVDILDTDYIELNTLYIEDIPAGIYQLTFSSIFTLSSTNQSGFIRVSVDGGVSWFELIREAKDSSDTITETYITTLNHGGGLRDIQVQAKRESTSADMNVVVQTIICEWKSDA